MGCGSSSSAQDKGRVKHATEHKADSNGKQNFPGVPEGAAQAANKNFGLTTHTIMKPLGVGGTGETWLCKRNDTGQEEAVKVITRGTVLKTLQKLLTNEITLQAELAEGHINIVDAHEVLLTESHLCLFMEYISGGTLTDYVSNKAESANDRNGLFCSEDEARYLFRQCISAVEYCHGRNVAHRDLKLDNTLLNEHAPPHVKICDFGFARLMGDNAKMTTGLGTAVYMAPQQIQKSQGKGYDGRAADVWACGVLLFVMLLGAFPFEHSTAAADEQRAFNEVHFEQIRIHWTENERNKEIVKRMSPECKDLLDQIFKIQETERITIPDIKKHPWFNEPLSDKYRKAMDELEASQARLQHENKLARASSGAQSQQEQIKQIVQCATMSRAANINNAQLEGKEIFLTRMHAKVQTGAVQLPADVVHQSDIRAPA